MPRPAYRGYLAPVIAISIMLVLLVATLSNLTAMHDTMRNNDQNMTWVMSRTQIKVLQLRLAAEQYDDSAQAVQDTSHALTLLLNRLHLLQEGPQKRFLEGIDTDHQLLQKTSIFLDAYQHAAQDGSLVPDQLDSLISDLDDLNQALNHASQQAMFQQWDIAGTQFDGYRNTVASAIALLAGILLCSLFISARLLLALKRTQESHALELRSIELESRLLSKQQANELYRHFASMISHQFRTPLAIMDGSLQRLLRTREPLSPETLSHRIGKTREAIARLTTVLDTLLITDQPLETERLPSEAHDLRSIAERAIAIQQLTTPHAQFELRDGPQAVVLAQCNPDMTEQVLLNLLSNAVKYGQVAAPVVVEVYPQDDTACCSVTDSGGRLAKDEVPEIFKRHFRGEHAATTLGSGVGLNIAQQLAQLQQGRIQVEVDPGHYTRFILALPLSE